MSYIIIPTWDTTFMDIAKIMAARSKDPSTKCGAVIIGPHKEIRSTGYNGFCRGINECDFSMWNDREIKYDYVEHAERNAIYNATLCGVSVEDCTMYIHGMWPCPDCVRAIIQSGIKHIYIDNDDIPERWRVRMERSRNMLAEAGIPVDLLGEQI